MKAIGVVAEYDPFHLGHAFHLSRTRALLGEDLPAVCVMSGSWTQRGECALTDKWTRAALALKGGADLILELPVSWAAASAERFARGAVEILAATGVVDALSFGSEVGETAPLQAVAQCLDSAAYAEALRAVLDTGAPFALCRQRAVEALVGKEGASVLSQPNNNLGVEYLRALNALNSPIRPVTVKREGAGHDGAPIGDAFASASHIRAAARRGDWAEVALRTPPGTAEALQEAGLAEMGRIDRAVLANHRTLAREDWAALADAGGEEGLPQRLVRAAQKAESLEEFYDLAKTKRYAHARIRRLSLWAFLGMAREARPPRPAYLRVLGFTPRGRELLKEMKGAASLPILTKPAHVKALSGETQVQFAAECRATDLHALCFPRVRPCAQDLTHGPVIME